MHEYTMEIIYYTYHLYNTYIPPKRSEYQVPQKGQKHHVRSKYIFSVNIILDITFEEKITGK